MENYSIFIWKGDLGKVEVFGCYENPEKARYFASQLNEIYATNSVKSKQFPNRICYVKERSYIKTLIKDGVEIYHS